MWGLYPWPRCDLGLDDRRRALVRRLRALAEPALRVPRWVSAVQDAAATSSALLRELLKRR
jgi:hypothetical protein